MRTRPGTVTALLATVAAVAMMVAAVVAMPAASSAAATTAPSNDEFSSKQWALPKIGAPAAWAAGTGAGVAVGVVDTGVDLAHEDLAGQVAASTNCVNSNGDAAACTGNAQDDQGHGTHVSGIIAAVKDNAKGIAGVAPGARLVVAKALDSSGSGSTDDINAGIQWVVDHGAKVVNLSLGGNVIITQVLGTSLSTGIEYAWSHGAIPVLASGNTQALGFGAANYGSLHAIVVGATGPDDEVAGYSSPTGDARWAVMAPGGDGQDASGQPNCDGSAAPRCIMSTFWAAGRPNLYAYDEGTSMAAPAVSGALAVLLGLGLTQQQAVDRLLATADRQVSCGPNSAHCTGRLDLGAATAGLAHAPAPATSAPTAPATTPTTRAGTTTVRPPGASPNSTKTGAGAAVPPSGAPAGTAPAPSVATAPPTTGGPPGAPLPVDAATASDAAGQGGAAKAALAAGPTRSRGGGSPGWQLALAALCLCAVAAAGGVAAWRVRRRPSASPGQA